MNKSTIKTKSKQIIKLQILRLSLIILFILLYITTEGLTLQEQLKKDGLQDEKTNSIQKFVSSTNVKIPQKQEICVPSITNKQESAKWLISAYCACMQCCGKTDGITASGKPVEYGYIACNWLKFGTKVRIEGLGIFTVQDRGAKSLFGSKNNHVRHIDVYLPTHKEARRFGVKYLNVEVLNG